MKCLEIQDDEAYRLCIRSELQAGWGEPKRGAVGSLTTPPKTNSRPMHGEHFMRNIGLSIICGFTLFVSGCSDAELNDAEMQAAEQGGETTGQIDSDTIDTDAEVDLSLPTQPNEPEVVQRNDGWLEIRPGGDTSCSRGTDYAYFVRPGDPEKVVVEFQGGGACWDDITCSVAGAIFIEDVENTRYLAGDYKLGIYDHSNPDNPFAA